MGRTASSAAAATVPAAWISLYHYAWFLSFGISGLAYFALAPRVGARRG